MTDNKIILGWCRRELCPSAQEIINRQQAEISVKRKLLEKAEETIGKQQAEIERLQKTIDKLKLDMSYMSSPNAIGDKHEMGCW